MGGRSRSQGILGVWVVAVLLVSALLAVVHSAPTGATKAPGTRSTINTGKDSSAPKTSEMAKEMVNDSTELSESETAPRTGKMAKKMVNDSTDVSASEMEALVNDPIESEEGDTEHHGDEGATKASAGHSTKKLKDSPAPETSEMSKKMVNNTDSTELSESDMEAMVNDPIEPNGSEARKAVKESAGSAKSEMANMANRANDTIAPSTNDMVATEKESDDTSEKEIPKQDRSESEESESAEDNNESEASDSTYADLHEPTANEMSKDSHGPTENEMSKSLNRSTANEMHEPREHEIFSDEHEPTASEMANNAHDPTASEMSKDLNEPTANEMSNNEHAPTASEMSNSAHEPTANEMSKNQHEPTASEMSNNAHEPTASEMSNNAHEPTASEMSKNLHKPAANEMSSNEHAPTASEMSSNSHDPTANEMSSNEREPTPKEIPYNLHEPAANEMSNSLQEPAANEISENLQEPAVNEMSSNLHETAGNKMPESLHEPAANGMSDNLHEPPANELSDNLHEPPANELSDNLHEPPANELSDNLHEPPANELSDNLHEPPANEMSDNLHDPPANEMSSNLQEPTANEMLKNAHGPATSEMSTNLHEPAANEMPNTSQGQTAIEMAMMPNETASVSNEDTAHSINESTGTSAGEMENTGAAEITDPSPGTMTNMGKATNAGAENQMSGEINEMGPKTGGYISTTSKNGKLKYGLDPATFKMLKEAVRQDMLRKTKQNAKAITKPPTTSTSVKVEPSDQGHVAAPSIPVADPLTQLPSQETAHIFTQAVGQTELTKQHSDDLPGQVCRSKADIGILLDGSADIGSDNFKKVLKFTQNLIHSFQVSPTGTHFGLAIVGGKPHVIFDFKAFNDPASIDKALAVVNFPGGRNVVGESMTALVTSWFKNSGRDGIPQLLLVVTSSKSKDDIKVPSQKLRNRGVRIQSVGVGSNFNTAQMEEMSTQPYSDNVLGVTNYILLTSVTPVLTKRLCRAIGGKLEKGPKYSVSAAGRRNANVKHIVKPTPPKIVSPTPPKIVLQSNDHNPGSIKKELRKKLYMLLKKLGHRHRRQFSLKSVRSMIENINGHHNTKYCKDAHDLCDQWSKRGLCEHGQNDIDSQSVQMVCPKSCKVCFR